MLRSRAVRLVTEDVGTKLLALVVAIVLWGVVTVLGSGTVTTEVPVGVTNLRNDLALASELKAVRVRLRAPRLLLQQRKASDLVRAFIDLSGRDLGAQSADVSVTPADPRADVLVVVPQRVDFVLDPIVQRTLPVRVVTEGTTADGFRVSEDATVTPDTVPARGPLGKLQTTPAIEVPVPVQDAASPIEGEFLLRIPPGLSVSPDRVQVRLPIIRAEETKTLGVRVVTRGAVARGFWVRAVETNPATVTVRGTADLLVSRTYIETRPVDLTGARTQLETDAQLALPERLTVVGAEPRVRVTAQIVPLEGSRELSAAVHVQDVPDGLRVGSVTPARVRVLVRGQGGILDRLQNDDVRVVISARGRDSGTFSARPALDAVQPPSEVQVVSLEGVDVTVSLDPA